MSQKKNATFRGSRNYIAVILFNNKFNYMYINISEKMKYFLPIIRITCNNFPLKK